MSDLASQLAAAIDGLIERKGANSPAVRGAAWRIGVVTAVGAGTVDVGAIRARRLASYVNPAVGDQIVLSMSGTGNAVALGRLSATADTAWVTYTPTWTASTTNPTLGNGSLVGRYVRDGRTITGNINMTLGSTTTIGSGNYSWDLPVAASDTATALCMAEVIATGRWHGHGVISPGATNFGIYMPASATNTGMSRVRSALGSPDGVLASGHTVRITFTYEAAF